VQTLTRSAGLNSVARPSLVLADEGDGAALVAWACRLSTRLVDLRPLDFLAAFFAAAFSALTCTTQHRAVVSFCLKAGFAPAYAPA
jgi:hypothetical protein